MATLTASGAQAAVQPKGLRVGLVAVHSVYSLTAAPSSGDIFQMVKVPANAMPVFIQFGTTTATPSWMYKVGDGVDTARYRSDATASAGQGMLLAYANVNTPVPYTYSTDDTIDIFCSTITASNATIGGAFYMNVIFSMNPT